MKKISPYVFPGLVKQNRPSSPYVAPGLENNPISEAIKSQIREMMLNDLSKAEIREKIQSAHPNFPVHLFETFYAEIFSSPF